VKARAALVLCALPLLLTACSSSPAAPPATSTPSAPAAPPTPGSAGAVLGFDGTQVLAPTADQASVRVLKRGDAPLQTVPSGDGSRGLAFPDYRADKEQRLVLVIEGADAAGTSLPAPVLTFGADVRLDAGTTNGRADNGDNVVQRGLYAEDDQYKLQVDHRVPSCRVKTPQGAAVLTFDVVLDEGWWRLGCRYDGSELTGRATALAGGQDRTGSTPAALGALSFTPSTVVSVGGKAGPGGALVVTQPDQFNGALDNVFVSPAP